MPESTYIGTSSVSGSYAGVEDLIEISMPANVKHDFAPASIQRWLRIATGRTDALLGQRFTVPLRMWSETIVWAVCEIAMAGLMNQRGHDPEGKTEKMFAIREAKALAWLESARDYEITPDARLQTQEPDKVGVMLSDAPRGWSGYSTHDPSGYATGNQLGRFYRGG